MRRLFVILVMSLVLPLVQVHAQTSDSSSACGNSMLITPGFNEREITLDGDTRDLIYYIPQSYDNTQAVPLILSLHGFASTLDRQVQYSQWENIADESGFIVAYPQGTGFPLRWNSGDLGIRLGDDTDDVQYLSGLMDWFITNWCIDQSRIYVNGLSNGGGMTDRIACELANRVAAVGMVAGAYNPLEDGCHPARPMPVIAFHGTSDFIVPYAGEENNLFDFPPIVDWLSAWADRDGCQSTPEILTISDDVTQTRYTECLNDVEVTLYTISGGGHVWYGGDMGFPFGNVDAIDATGTMWTFYQRFSLTSNQ